MAENKTKFLPGWAQGNDFKYNFDFYPKWFDSRNEKTWQRWKVGIYMYAWWEQKIPFPPEVISAWKILMRSEESVNIVQDENLQKEFISKLNTIFSTKKFRFKTKIIDKTKFNINNPESSINYLSLWKNEILVSEDWHSSYQQDCPERMEAKSHGADYFEDVLVEPKLPKINMLYWLAEITAAHGNQLCILETPTRQDLGSRGNVDVLAYGNKVTLYLNCAAVMLGHDWPKLPTVLAMAEHEKCAFRANRDKPQGVDTNALLEDIFDIEG